MTAVLPSCKRRSPARTLRRAPLSQIFFHKSLRLVHRLNHRHNGQKQFVHSAPLLVAAKTA